MTFIGYQLTSVLHNKLCYAKACDITSFNWTAFIPYLIAMKTGSEVCELLSTQSFGPDAVLGNSNR
jgi:hypothetical protein